MSYIKAIILGLLEGLTEFLPVSGSGHLSALQYVMGYTGDDAMLMNVLLHTGTMLAAVVCFRKELAALAGEAGRLIADIFRGRVRFAYIKDEYERMNGTRRRLLFLIVSSAPLLFLALPVGGGKQVSDLIAGLLADDNLIGEGIFFILWGVVLIFSQRREKRLTQKREMDLLTAFFVGAAQLFSALPGVSRSGAAVCAGTADGVEREEMVSYSFILSIPAVLAADLSQLSSVTLVGSTLTGGHIAVGILAAAAAGVGAFQLLKWMMKKDLIRYCGHYAVWFGAFCLGANAASALILHFGG